MSEDDRQIQVLRDGIERAPPAMTPEELILLLRDEWRRSKNEHAHEIFQLLGRIRDLEEQVRILRATLP